MSLTRNERRYLEGKLGLEKGSAYDRRVRSDLKKKLGYTFAVVCVYCERGVTEGGMWRISAGDNAVFACLKCAPAKVRARKVMVTQQGIKHI